MRCEAAKVALNVLVGIGGDPRKGFGLVASAVVQLVIHSGVHLGLTREERLHASRRRFRRHPFLEAALVKRLADFVTPMSECLLVAGPKPGVVIGHETRECAGLGADTFVLETQR